MFAPKSQNIKFSNTAMEVLKSRYLLKDASARVIENPEQMFRRVARTVAAVDEIYNKKASIREVENKFYSMMSSLDFMPNSPTLMNAGTKIGQLSACFVLPIEDSMESIFEALKQTALIHQSGGGTGFSFSRLRPKGDIVGSTRGHSSGPVSFMKVFDISTEVIKQGGKRRGANMAVLRINHPDIEEFIASKLSGELQNFNISVAITDKFMEAVEKDKAFDLINPKDGKKVKTVKAKELFSRIVESSWKCGDPGIIFIDEVNNHNPTPSLGRIESTNPCGEVPLLPYESCNLGSINLSNFVQDGVINYDRLKIVIKDAVHFLDNVIDANKYPLKIIEETTKGNRKIGLGVMGFADMLIKLNIAYDSEQAVKVAGDVMNFISNEARKSSEELGKQRGSFPNFRKSRYSKSFKHLRNATVTTIAPTGSISIIANCSSSIEPLFGVVFERNIMDNNKFVEFNPIFEETLVKLKIDVDEIKKELVDKKGDLKAIEKIPSDVKKVFVTSTDIDPEWHVKMQAAFQKYTDNAVSKTVNLPNEAKLEDVRNIFILAYTLKCKGITIYRAGSKQNEVINKCVECI